MQNVSLVTVDSRHAPRVTLETMPFVKYALSFNDAVPGGPSIPVSFPVIHASWHFANTDGVRTLEPLEAGGGDSPEVRTHG